MSFIGPSGCGKSSLLRSFNRMNDLIDGIQTEGDIQLDGKSIMGKKRNIVSLRTKVGMVFQKPNPFPMSIYNNVAFGPKSHGIKKKDELDKIVKDSLINAAL
jgi:phosphate transport system ATP-binding protein